MNYFEESRSGITQEPEIVTDTNGAFVIIGSRDHGIQIPQVAAPKLVTALNGVEALKMEGMETISSHFHPMSTEVLTKVCVKPSQLSWIAESDEEDIGQKLTKYGVSKNLMEVFVPSLIMKMHHGVPENFFENLPIIFDSYKPRFGFLNTEDGIESFLTVARYWKRHKLDPMDLVSFSNDFEMFMGNVREHEYWRPDLRKFREDYSGKIAVCCGAYHVPFVQSVLEGRETEKPDWENHIYKNNDPFVAGKRELLKEIYENIETSLKGAD